MRKIDYNVPNNDIGSKKLQKWNNIFNVIQDTFKTIYTI